MRNYLVILVLCLCSLANAVPLGLKKNMAIVQEQEDPMLVMAEDEETRPEIMISRLNLPSNATSIRADITDGFSCDNKTYGYYADVENECQIFHVCLPVTYADGKENTFRWSFICPEETVFSQEYFTCMRAEDMSIDCEESFKYYELNRNFGMIEPEEVPADEAEEEMIMENMSRQPPSVVDEQTNKQTIENSPAKKQTNRRKTQANRVVIEGQRKKVQPLRRLPKPVALTTTAKPIVEESPILEQEVEKTTLKYQRLTKRPILLEASKPEETKPEKDVVRQDLFAQKRKRPQIFFPTRFDATLTSDTESKPLPLLKTDILMQKQSEPVEQSPSESQAEASEITEVSIKPQVQLKSDPQPEKINAQNKEPAVVYVPVEEEKKEDKPITELKSEPVPLSENIPSRVEVLEIPIQKLEEPLINEGPAVVAQIPEKNVSETLASEETVPEEVPVLKSISEISVPSVIVPDVIVPDAAIPDEVATNVAVPDVPAAEESKPLVSVVQPINTQEKEIPAEDILLKKIIAQAENKVELNAPVEGEKGALDPLLEPELISLNDPEQSLQSLKSVEPQKLTETVKSEEPLTESKIVEQSYFPDIISIEKPNESLEESRPEILLKLETPVAEKEPIVDSMPDDLLKAANVVKEVTLSEGPTTKQQEPTLDEDPSSEQQEVKSVKIPVEEPIIAEIVVPEAQTALKINSEAPEDPEVEEYKLKDLVESSKPQSMVSEMSETQPDDSVNIEESAPEPQILLKSETNDIKPIEPLAVETPSVDISAKGELFVPETAPVIETSESQVNKQFESENPNQDSLPELEKPVDDEISLNQEEKITMAEPVSDVEIEHPIEEISKPLDHINEEIKEEIHELPGASEIDLDKTSEIQAEEKIQETEKEIVQSTNDNEEAQSLILDFISSLVNSENSNFEDQSAVVNEIPSDNLPESSISEPVVAGPTNDIQSQDDQVNPLYIPMMPNNDQMYQIPVQVIETPEPEPVPAIPVPAVAEPKLPLTIDDVVELVKESLDTPAEKENVAQEPSNDDPNSPSESEEVKPIYHRYIDLGSNLLKSEALTASEDEPVVIPTENEQSDAKKEEVFPELPKNSEKLTQTEQLALKPEPESQSDVQAIKNDQITLEEKADPQTLVDNAKEGRSLNRFKMDPRKR